MRGDMRRFGLLVACLAVGTALIAGVSSVGASIRQAVERDAAVLMGGDVELVARRPRRRRRRNWRSSPAFGQVSHVVDTNVRAEAGDARRLRRPDRGRRDLSAARPGRQPETAGRTTRPFDFLGSGRRPFGALVDPLMLDQLGVAVGDTIQIGGTPFEVRGALGGLPDAAVRGFRLGLPAVITTEALAVARRPHLAAARPRHLVPLQGAARRHRTPKTARPRSKPRSAIRPGPSARRATGSARWCATTTSSCASW